MLSEIGHTQVNRGTVEHPPVVFLAAVAFDSCLSGRTRRLAESLAKAGHDVTFVDLPSVRRAIQSPPWGRRSVYCRDGVRVIRLLPLPWRLRAGWPRWTSGWTNWAVRKLERHVPALTSAVVVTSTPWWLPVLERLPAALRCYDYLDHIDVQAGPRRLELFRSWDEELLIASDIVTTVSAPLRDDLGRRHPDKHLHLVPNGVCGSWVDQPVKPVDRGVLTPRPRAPIAGFLGALFEWVDLTLLAECARSLPDVEFVVVGPTRRGVSIDRLRGVPNVHCHAAVPFERVPEMLAAFDVCLIPFKRDLIAEYADPLKVYEYCALGKPVVSTVLFNTGGPEPPIRVATTAEAFAAAIVAGLRETPADRAKRIAFARQHTWEARAAQFGQIVTAAVSDAQRPSAS